MNRNEVSIRDVAPSDLEIFYRHQRDPAATRMAAFPMRPRGKFMAHWRKILVDSTVLKRTILNDGVVAGYLVSFEHNGEPLVGYWIGREYWDRGIATRALASFLDEVEARPLYARVAKHNLASLRVLEKCGFSIVGEDRDATEDGSPEIEEFILRIDAECADERGE